ncbi:hypothetical protein MKEN_00230600 [Mycena kentingensis (nom. inval.)]|nr:hypothetical protein MKEN_00230600 [Mycena kentingensis (nom. inval.)]
MTSLEPMTVVFDDISLFPLSESTQHLYTRTILDGKDTLSYNQSFTTLSYTRGCDLAFAFDGVAVSLFGIAPDKGSNQTFLVSLSSTDIPTAGSPPSTSQMRNYHAPAYGGLQTMIPSTDPQFNMLCLAEASGFSLDYALIKVSPNTILTGKTILVDNTSPQLSWEGSWISQNNFTLPIPVQVPGQKTTLTAEMAPHGNTTHENQQIGDAFVFAFTGTSVVVHGLTPAPIGQPFNLGLSFSLDGTEQFVNLTNEMFAFEGFHVSYFRATDLAQTNHTLIGRVVHADGSVVPRARLDYVTYQPSFSTQANMPILSPVLPTDPQPGSSTSSGALSSAGASSTLSLVSQSSAAATIVPASKSTPSRTIVGTAVAGTTALLLLVCIVYFWVRRWLRRREITAKNSCKLVEPYLTTPTLQYTDDDQPRGRTLKRAEGPTAWAPTPQISSPEPIARWRVQQTSLASAGPHGWMSDAELADLRGSETSPPTYHSPGSVGG